MTDIHTQKTLPPEALSEEDRQAYDTAKTLTAQLHPTQQLLSVFRTIYPAFDFSGVPHSEGYTLLTWIGPAGPVTYLVQNDTGMRLARKAKPFQELKGLLERASELAHRAKKTSVA